VCSVGSAEHLGEGFGPLHFLEEFWVVFEVFEVSFPKFGEFCLFFGLDNPRIRDYNGHVSSFTSLALGMMHCFYFLVY